MTRPHYQQILATFTPEQLAVLRVSIMAERRQRTSAQPLRTGESALGEAYEWALKHV